MASTPPSPPRAPPRLSGEGEAEAAGRGTGTCRFRRSQRTQAGRNLRG